jgi:hypothetical protein
MRNGRLGLSLVVLGALAYACGGAGVIDLGIPSGVGGPVAAFSESSIDFGAGSCGAPTTHDLTITNAGLAQLDVTVSIRGTGFAIVGAGGSGQVMTSIAPGAQFTVQVQAVANGGTVGTATSGSLSITTNDPNQATVTVPLVVRSTGATIMVSTAAGSTNAAFGLVSIGTNATPVAVKLTNSGSSPATVRFGTSSDSQFGVDTQQVEVPANGSVTVHATFRPTRTSPSNATIPVSIVSASGDPICGSTGGVLSLSGQGTTSLVTSSPGSGSTVDFGMVHCGVGGARSQTITITNAATTPFTFDATLNQGTASPFQIDTPTRTVPAASNGHPGSLTISVSQRALNFTTPGIVSDALRITSTSGNAEPITLTLSLDVVGAVLSLTAPPAFNDAVPGGTAETQLVFVTNSGNLPASPTLTIASQSAGYTPFAVTGALGTVLPNGGRSGANVAFQPRSGDGNTDTATLRLMAGANDVLCGGLPADLVIQGTAQTGTVIVTPSSLAFGDANGVLQCNGGGPTGTGSGPQANPRTFDIRNAGATPFSFQATLGKAQSPFALSAMGASSVPGGISGTVPAGQTVTVVVTPAPLPFPTSTQLDAYGDVVTVTTSVTGDNGHTIALRQGAQGAVLSFASAANPIDDGAVLVNTTGSTSFSVVNTGNGVANVTLNVMTTSGDPNAFDVNGAPNVNIIGLMGGSDRSLDYSPKTATTSSGKVTMSVDATTALCAPLPPELDVTGQGTNSLVKTAPQSVVNFTGPGMSQSGVNFQAPQNGYVYCGTRAGAQTITISNQGGPTSPTFHITDVTLGQGANSPYSVTGPGGASPVGMAVAPNGSLVLTITTADVPFPFDFKNPAKSFQDMLSISTDAANDSAHAFTLNQTPYGAVLDSFTPVGGVFPYPPTGAGSSASIGVGIQNDGNASAQLVFSAISPMSVQGTFSFDNANLPAFAGIPGAASLSGHFNPPAGSSGTTFMGSATFGVTNTPLCAPLPLTNVTMTGTATDPPTITIAPTSINLANIACGATVPSGAPTQQVTITNKTPSMVTYSVNIPTVQEPGGGASANFALNNPTPCTGGLTGVCTSGTIAGNGGTASFTVSPAPVPTGANVPTNGAVYTTTVSVTAGASNFSIPLTETASGLSLAFAQTGLIVHHHTLTTPATFKVQNFGNLAGDVTVTLSGGVPTGSELECPAGLMSCVQNLVASTIAGPIAAGSQGISNGFSGGVGNPGNGSGSATLSVTSTAAVCTPMPTLPVSFVTP